MTTRRKMMTTTKMATTTLCALGVQQRRRGRRRCENDNRFASVSTPYPVKIDNFTCDSHFNGLVDLYLMPIRVFNRIVRYSEKSCSRPLLRTVRLSGGRRGHQGGRHVGVAVRVGRPPSWGEGDYDAVLLQRLPLRRRLRTTEKTRKATTATAKTEAAEATETMRSRHINIIKHTKFLIHLCLYVALQKPRHSTLLYTIEY